LNHYSKIHVTTVRALIPITKHQTNKKKVPSTKDILPRVQITHGPVLHQIPKYDILENPKEIILKFII